MAITDPRAKAFSDNYERRFADLLASTYYSALAMLNQWNGQSLSTVIPNTSAILQDSAAPNGVDATGGDGRSIVTGAQLTNIINRATDIKNLMEGSATVAANDGTKAVLNTVLAVKVNGQPIF